MTLIDPFHPFPDRGRERVDEELPRGALLLHRLLQHGPREVPPNPFLLDVGGASSETRFKLKPLYALSGSRVESMSLSS